MKQFIIFHPKNGVINHSCTRGQYAYEEIATIEANTLQGAFIASQNDFSDAYAKLDKRSTCVGDIIVDVETQLHYFIAIVGFTEIPCTVTQYHDWTNDEPNNMQNDFAFNYYGTSYKKLTLWQQRHVDNQIDAALTSHF